MTLALRYAARSDVGLIREGNEDAGYAGPHLLAIADGMGGHAAGEVASSITVATIEQLDEEPPGSDLLTALAVAIDEANLQLRQMIEGDDALEGMGTTLTALLFAGSRVGIAHIGDSRAFLLRGGEFSQITHDHTFVQTLVDEGRISAAEAEHHPQRSLLMRALDGRSQPEPDLSVRDVRPGDRYLVCSDGLSGVLSEDTMRATLLRGRVEESVDELVELALRAGGPDNVTCIVADVIDSTDTAEVLGPSSSSPQFVGAADDPKSRQGRGPLADSAAGRAALLQPRVDDDDDDEELQVAGRSRRRWVLPAVLLGAFVVLLGVGGYAGLQLVRNQYYVGVDDGNVAIFQGVSSTLVGRSLSSVYEPTNVSVDGLPNFDRARVEQTIPARDLADARAIVERIEAEATRCAAFTTPAPTLPANPPPVATAPTLPATPTPAPTSSVPAECLGAGGGGEGS